MLYLQEYAPGDYGTYFQGLTLGEPGIYGNNTYVQISQALHDLYQQHECGASFQPAGSAKSRLEAGSTENFSE